MLGKKEFTVSHCESTLTRGKVLNLTAVSGRKESTVSHSAMDWQLL